MPVIPLVPSDSPTLISSLLRLSAHHLALSASASQPLKSGTLSLYLSLPVPVLTPSVVISRPTTASRPSTPLNRSPLAPQIRLLLTIVRVYKLLADFRAPYSGRASELGCTVNSVDRRRSTLSRTERPHLLIARSTIDMPWRHF